jgi:hypothetical protein
MTIIELCIPYTESITKRKTNGHYDHKSVEFDFYTREIEYDDITIKKEECNCCCDCTNIKISTFDNLISEVKTDLEYIRSETNDIQDYTIDNIRSTMENNIFKKINDVLNDDDIEHKDKCEYISNLFGDNTSTETNLITKYPFAHKIDHFEYEKNYKTKIHTRCNNVGNYIYITFKLYSNNSGHCYSNATSEYYVPIQICLTCPHRNDGIFEPYDRYIVLEKQNLVYEFIKIIY